MEVAALQMSVDSSGVVKGAGDLARLSSSAQNAANDAAKVERAMGGVSSAASRAAASVNSEVNAINKSSVAMRAYRAAVAMVGNAYDFSRDALYHWGRQLGLIKPQVDAAAQSVKRFTQAANDNTRAMKANTSNIAAQFQDIGVTAAMNMNPMIIGLQQGTQLSAVFAQSGKSMGVVLAAAFKQVVSAQALMTIGIVAAVAALIQMVEWTKLAASTLNRLADVMVTIAPYAVAAAAAIALFYAPAILTGIASLTIAIGVKLVKAIEAAMWRLAAMAVMNPWGFFILMTAAAVTALLVFRDWFTKVLGVDLIDAAAKGINFIVGGFVGGFDAVKKTWSLLPQAVGDAAIQAANVTIQAIQGMVNGAISLINGLTQRLPFGVGDNLQMGDVSFGSISNPYEGVAQAVNDVAAASIAAAQSVDYVGKAIQGIRTGAAAVAKQFREWAKALGASDDKKKKKGGKTDAEKLSDILRGAAQDISAQQLRLDGVGKAAQDVARLEQETKLLNAVQNAGIKITPRIANEISKLATEYAKLKIAADVAEAIEGVTESLDRQHRSIMDDISLIGKYGDELVRAKNEIDALRSAQDALPKGVDINSPDMAGYRADVIAAAGQKSDAEIAKRQAENIEKIRRERDLNSAAMDAERGAIGLSGQALIEYNFIQDKLLQAKRDGIDLSPAEVSAIRGVAEAYARERHEIDQLKESIDAGREVVGDFLSSWMTGMREGRNVFKSFLDSVLDGLNKLAQKLTDKIIDNFLNTLGGHGGGTLGGIGKALGFANGGVFATGGVQQFAKGGAFTNSIVNTPTLFRFANGGAIGEMGEAGPEAIMPLKRGADGSLGVQVHGGAQQIEIVVRPLKGTTFDADVEVVANNSAAKVVTLGLNEFNEMLPDRIQEISDDPRRR